MDKSKGRHELKLEITYSDYLQLHSRLSPIAPMDENSKQGQGYRVRSLYFDNYEDKALREKIDGVNEREKFRLRFYNDDPTFIRLEKKSKVNGICFKESKRVTYEVCEKLLQGEYEDLKTEKDPLLIEFYTKLFSQQLRPKNIVDYQRDAYVYTAGNVRVTMDHHIRTSYDVKSFLRPELITVPISKGIILEVKYDHFLPEIIRGLVALSSRQSTAYSKYAATRLFGQL